MSHLIEYWDCVVDRKIIIEATFVAVNLIMLCFAKPVRVILPANEFLFSKKKKTSALTKSNQTIDLASKKE